jgi:DNA-binding MarR family transcriptional regulator
VVHARRGPLTFGCCSRTPRVGQEDGETRSQMSTQLRLLNDNEWVSSEREETERFLAAWLEVRQMVQAANFNRFHQAGLSATQFMTLNVIPKEGLSLSELARKLNLSPATLNETVNSLEARSLLQRFLNEQDPRKIPIIATAEGTKMQNSASEEFHHTLAELFARMSPKGRRALLAGLEEFASLSQ